MEVDFGNLVKEGQEFMRLRHDFKKSNNPPAGSVGFLISLDWITKYKKHIQYDTLRRNMAPTPLEENDVELPGKITNSDFLDTDPETHLQGTAPAKADNGQETECIDRYIK